MAFERKEIFKNSLPEDYKTICDQGHSESKYLLREDLANTLSDKAYAFYEPLISYNELRVSPSSLSKQLKG